jgi:hypothetical protein
MTDPHDVWRRKSDEELKQAATVLHEYTPAGRKAILDELARRGFDAVDERPMCPYCQVRIGLRDDHERCGSCGKAFPTSFREVLSGWAGDDEADTEDTDTTSFVDGPQAGAAVSGELGSDQETPSRPRKSNAAVTRYRDGYRVAAFVVAVGTVFKFLGVLIGSVIALSVVSGSNGLIGSGGSLFAGATIGLVVGGSFFISGVFVAALGQVLQATLDTAVASSPFLTDRERARAMGLPETLATRRPRR